MSLNSGKPCNETSQFGIIYNSNMEIVSSFSDFMYINNNFMQLFNDNLKKQIEMSSPRRQTTDDDRRRIIDAYLACQKISTIAEILGLKRSTVNAVIKVYQEVNRLVSKKRGGVKVKKLTSESQERIRVWVDENCSLTLK